MKRRAAARGRYACIGGASSACCAEMQATLSRRPRSGSRSGRDNVQQRTASDARSFPWLRAPPRCPIGLRRHAFRRALTNRRSQLRFALASIVNAGTRRCRRRPDRRAFKQHDYMIDQCRCPARYCSGVSSDTPRAEPIAISKCSRTNADDRLPFDPLGRVERGDRIVEGRDGADVRPQSSVPHPLDDLAQLGTIGLDNEVDRQSVGGRPSRRPRATRICIASTAHAAAYREAECAAT